MNTTGKKKFFQQYQKMAGKYAGAATPRAEGFRPKFQHRIQQLAKQICGDKNLALPANSAAEDFDSE